jgi:hypothetical protein
MPWILVPSPHIEAPIYYKNVWNGWNKKGQGNSS